MMGRFLADLGLWTAQSCLYTTAPGHGYAWSTTAFWRDVALARAGAMVFGWGKYRTIRHLDKQPCLSLADGGRLCDVIFLYTEPRGDVSEWDLIDGTVRTRVLFSASQVHHRVVRLLVVCCCENPSFPCRRKRQPGERSVISTPGSHTLFLSIHWDAAEAHATCRHF